jgi:hypothetical protein
MSQASDAIAHFPAALAAEDDGAAPRMEEQHLLHPRMDQKVLPHNKEMAREFLVALDPTATEFTFQFLSDDRRKRYAKIFHGSLDQVWPKIQELNTRQRGVGVFVTVNETDGKGRNSKNIVRVRALFADADSDEQVERCNQAFEACDIMPSMVVKTGRGAHYYFLTEVYHDKFREWQEKLIGRLGTDPAIKDLARVMRFPGTLHLKDPNRPRLVQLESVSGHRWTLPQLAMSLELSAPVQPAPSPPVVTQPNGHQCNIGAFTGADSQRLQELFGHLTDNLSDGLEADVEQIRSAVAAIPPEAIANENDWLRLARGLAHEAATHRKQSEPLWEVLDAISRRAPRYDQEDNRRRWERYITEAFNSDSPITIATVFDLAHKHGWQGLAAAKISPSNPAVAVGSNSSRAVPVASLPLIPPKRLWLHGNDLMRGGVSMFVAPGGKAKSTWLLTCGLACASGRPLLGAHIFGGPLNVLYISAEDPIDEIARRLRAAMQHHGLSDADVASYHVIGAATWGLSLLRTVGAAPMIDEQGWSALRAELDRIQPDVLIIDPLINFMGGVDANNNSAAALLIGQLAALAAGRRIAIMVAHHAAKGRDPTSAESAMGAASFVNLCRIALSIEPLAETAAGRIGVPHWEAKSVFRVLGTKQNFSPPNAADRWYRISSVEIQNQQPPTYPNGDRVAVVETFTPGSSGPVYPEELIKSALEAIDTATPPLSNATQSRARYAAPVIAHAIAKHRSGMVSELDGKAILGHLIDSGLVQVQSIKIARPGKGTDERKGLFLTGAGRALVEAVAQVPQATAVVTAGIAVCAGGDQPCGSPAPLGGCGGNAGGGTDAGA